jgi:hypothetical protein
LAHLHTISRTHSPSSLLFPPSLSLAPMNPTGGRLLGTESDGNGRFEDAKSHWDFYRCVASRSLNPLMYTAPSPLPPPPPNHHHSLFLSLPCVTNIHTLFVVELPFPFKLSL